jgi:peptide/nickel transport system substrate-binding protein
LVVVATFVLVLALACTTEKVVQLPGETIIKEVQVPGETVIVEKEVVKTVEVIKEVQVAGKTMVVEKEVVKIVEVKAEGSLTIAMKTFGNETFQANLTPVSMLIFPLYDTFLQRDTQGTLVEGAVTEWTMSSDGTTWDLKTREGMTFHDGTAVTGEDIKFNLDISLRPKAKGVFKKKTKEVRLIDNDTVSITFLEPWLTYPSEQLHRDSKIIPKNAYEAAEAATDWPESWNTSPVGSGPYKFVEQVFGHSTDYEAFLDYWGGQPHFKDLRLLLVPEDTTRKALLKTGKVDAIAVSVLDVEELTKKDIRIIKNPGAVNSFFWFANSYRPTDEGWDASLPWVADIDGPAEDWERARKVREAFNLAVDRDGIHQVIYNGLAEKTALPFMGTGVPGSEYRADLKPYPFDPARAKQLLKEANFPMDMTITIASFILSGAPEMPEIAQAAATMWETNLGIKTEIFNTEWRAGVGAAQRDKTTASFDISVMRNSTRPTALDNSKYFTQDSWSYCYMVGDEFYDLYKSGTTALDIELQNQIAGEVFSFAYREFCTVPIAIVPVLYAVSDRIGDWPLQPGHPWFHNYQFITKAK